MRGCGGAGPCCKVRSKSFMHRSFNHLVRGGRVSLTISNPAFRPPTQKHHRHNPMVTRESMAAPAQPPDLQRRRRTRSKPTSPPLLPLLLPLLLLLLPTYTNASISTMWRVQRSSKAAINDQDATALYKESKEKPGTYIQYVRPYPSLDPSLPPSLLHFLLLTNLCLFTL